MEKTDINNEKEEELYKNLLYYMNGLYKIDNDKRSRMGERLSVRNVQVWKTDVISEEIRKKILQKANEKLEEYSADIKREGFFKKFIKQMDLDECNRIDITEITDKLENKYLNCIITEDTDMINDNLIREKYNNKISCRILYNKNVVICLVKNGNVDFYICNSIRTLTRNGFEKYNIIKKHEFIYNKIKKPEGFFILEEMEEFMNRAVCKKFLRLAYLQAIAHNKIINTKNIEDEMNSVIEKQSREYIAFSKIAVHNLENSANNKIDLNDLLNEIDILPAIYTKITAIERAKNL